MKWEALDEMSQEFVCRTGDVSAYAWRTKDDGGCITWNWRVSRSSGNTVVTGFTPIANMAFAQAEAAIEWISGANV